MSGAAMVGAAAEKREREGREGGKRDVSASSTLAQSSDMHKKKTFVFLPGLVSDKYKTTFRNVTYESLFFKNVQKKIENGSISNVSLLLFRVAFSWTHCCVLWSW